MFQDASTNPALPNSPDEVAEATSETGGFSSNSYADRLMDDLFQDVEQLLHGESIRSQPVDLSSEPISESVSEPESASASEIAPASSLSAPVEEPSASSALATLLKSLAVNPPGEPIVRVPEMTAMATSGAVVERQNRPAKGAYDRLLLAVGCVSVVVSLALWLFYQESRRPPMVSSVPAAEVAANPVSSTQNQFSDYAQKALQSIDQRSQQGISPASTPGLGTAGVTSGMPTVTVPKAIDPGSLPPNRTATGLERVYVPVYQFPSNFKPPNSVTPLPTGAAPLAGPQSGAPVRKPAATATNPITPGAPRRLAGVLELGDRSVALFEINGVTQRYGIGESIGSSGWSLVEVSKEQAMIRRNGEVRSVFVGQNF